MHLNIARSQLSNGARRAVKLAGQRRYASNNGEPSSRMSALQKGAAFFVVASIGAGGVFAATRKEPVKAAVVPAPAEMVQEKRRKKTKTAEEYKDQISSQHLQVKKSWENPGVYAWGSNTGLVVAPESSEPAIKTPHRFTYFDGMVLRDLKMDRNYAAAVTAEGDLLQWGIDYSTDFPGPIKTLTGKNITKISLTKDSVIALGKNGTVYNVPVSREVQLAGPKVKEDSSVPFWNGISTISYTTIKPQGLGFSEKIKDISAGREHCLLLSSNGRTFSAATGAAFPTKGQLGIPELAKPTVPLREVKEHPAHEIEGLKNIKITHIAAGDNHSVASDEMGRIFAWGDNSAGQLGFEPTPETTHIDAPSMLPIDKLYVGTKLLPYVTSIAAGGNDTYFCVDAKEPVKGMTQIDTNSAIVASQNKVTADTWACGQGIYGSLGNGKWTHFQGVPVKIKALSGLSEYNEATNTTVPIRLSRLTAGATHASAQMDNHSNVSAGTDKHEMNFGADVLFWGGNEFYQLGTGRRNNLNVPSYIAPLDVMERDVKDKKVGSESAKRFQITPRAKVHVGDKKMEVEQRVVCGRGVTGVFSAVPRD